MTPRERQRALELLDEIDKQDSREISFPNSKLGLGKYLPEEEEQRLIRLLEDHLNSCQYRKPDPVIGFLNWLFGG